MNSHHSDHGKILNWTDEPGVKSAGSHVAEKGVVWFDPKGCNAVNAPIEARHIFIECQRYRVADKTNPLINF